MNLYHNVLRHTIVNFKIDKKICWNRHKYRIKKMRLNKEVLKTRYFQKLPY